MSVGWHWFLDSLLTPLFLEVPEAPTAAETIGNDAPLACASLGATVSATKIGSWRCVNIPMI